jgi:hypothetical protein
MFLTGALGVGIVAGSVRYIQRHVAAEVVPSEMAAAELDRQALRFLHQEPLREIRDGHEPLRHLVSSASPGSRNSVRALISDARSGRLVRASMPLGVLRIAKRSGFRYLGELTPLLQDTEFESDRIDISVAELEQRGPGLLIDHAHRSGARILMWVE